MVHGERLNERKISARTNIEPFLDIVTRFTMARETEKIEKKREEKRKRKKKKSIYILYIQNYIVDTEW